MTASDHLNRHQDWDHDEHEKTTPKKVDYRLATGAHNCGGCSMKHGSACDILTIKVDARHVCDEYDPK